MLLKKLKIFKDRDLDKQIDDIVQAINNSATTDYMITEEGGIAVPMVNNTGADSVKGLVVEPSSGGDNYVTTAVVSSKNAIGVIAEDGIANGENVFVVVAGVAKCLVETGTYGYRTGFAKMSTTEAGRITTLNTTPTSPDMTGLGRCIESTSTNESCNVALRFGT